ncbi:putative nucleotide-binding protein [Sphingomonas zeicaulis]|uniref:TIR domain-containing protein n=1 Tax=Sphingomonas zeicaulis TaxID=1632740 RepID=UPI003D223012
MERRYSRIRLCREDRAWFDARYAEGSALNGGKPPHYVETVQRWRIEIYEKLAQYDRGADEAISASSASRWARAGWVDGNQPEGADDHEIVLRQSLTILRGIIEDDCVQMCAETARVDAAPRMAPSSKVFIAHSSDDDAKNASVSFVQQLGFQPVTVDERLPKWSRAVAAASGQGDVDFSLVLLSGDEEFEGPAGESLVRPCQTVMLGLGYLAGCLGRGKVYALKREHVSIPYDLPGIGCLPMDNRGGWKWALARELQAGGHHIDWTALAKTA